MIFIFFQVVSCFRSSGAMPIPKVTPTIKAPPPRPKPRKLELPSTQEAQEIDLDIEMETTEELPEFEYWDEHLTETVVPRLTRCMIIPHPKIIDIINDHFFISLLIKIQELELVQNILQRPISFFRNYMENSNILLKSPIFYT